MRAHIRYSSILLISLKQYISTLINRVELHISSCLSDRVTIGFDDYSNPETNYVAFFATYVSVTAMKNETAQNAERHICFLKLSLSVLRKAKEMSSR